jgi:ring-1,2-phenylacetyl-CoA epoxidase subunit PaaD
MSIAVPELESPQENWKSAIWALLATVKDPEIPILSIVELGIVRYVHGESLDTARVGLTPTYSGCPATDVIRRSVETTLARGGITPAAIETVLAPPWTSDWISAEGRVKLAAYGIAPPAESVGSARRLLGAAPVACPRCASSATRRVSEFGSTPCKAHYLCSACLEPFDYFKCI